MGTGTKLNWAHTHATTGLNIHNDIYFDISLLNIITFNPSFIVIPKRYHCDTLHAHREIHNHSQSLLIISTTTNIHKLPPRSSEFVRFLIEMNSLRFSDAGWSSKLKSREMVDNASVWKC